MAKVKNHIRKLWQIYLNGHAGKFKLEKVNIFVKKKKWRRKHNISACICSLFHENMPAFISLPSLEEGGGTNSGTFATSPSSQCGVNLSHEIDVISPFPSPTLDVIRGSVNMEDGMEASTNSLLKDGNKTILRNMNSVTMLCS